MKFHRLQLKKNHAKDRLHEQEQLWPQSPLTPCDSPWRISCSATSARPARTGCGIDGAACGSTCEGTTRTPSHRKAAGRLPGPPHRILDTREKRWGAVGGDGGRQTEEREVMGEEIKIDKRQRRGQGEMGSVIRKRRKLKSER